VATGAKFGDAETGEIKPKRLRWVATGCRGNAMVNSCRIGERVSDDGNLDQPRRPASASQARHALELWIVGFTASADRP
jgi:hypothetical protein